MKPLSLLALHVFFSLVVGLFAPWWSFAVVVFLISFFAAKQKTAHAFLCGFLGIFILWGLLSLLINWRNQSILSNKIAVLFGLHSHQGILLVLITGLVGALVGGLSALSGAYFKRYLQSH